MNDWFNLYLFYYFSGSNDNIFEGLDVDETIKAAITTYIKRRLAPQPVKIRADIEVTCFSY